MIVWHARCSFKTRRIGDRSIISQSSTVVSERACGRQMFAMRSSGGATVFGGERPTHHASPPMLLVQQHFVCTRPDVLVQMLFGGCSPTSRSVIRQKLTTRPDIAPDISVNDTYAQLS